MQYSYRRTAAPRSQYVHRTGTLLVSILGGADGFSVVPNRIFLSHSAGLAKAEDVQRDLERLCGDQKGLERLWGELRPVVAPPVLEDEAAK